jgi:hypothetical protein
MIVIIISGMVMVSLNPTLIVPVNVVINMYGISDGMRVRDLNMLTSASGVRRNSEGGAYHITTQQKKARENSHPYKIGPFA